jgi:hypothetical protein
MRFRTLRIAFSAACGVVCLLLIVLWVRSYWWNDVVFRLDPANKVTTLGSSYGAAYFARMVLTPLPGDLPPRTPHGWKISSTEANELQKKFAWEFTPGKVIVMFPYWIPVVTFAILAATPWAAWSKRFSYVGACQV